MYDKVPNNMNFVEREVQVEKATAPIEVATPLMVRDVKPVQFIKAALPMEVTLSGIVTD